VNVCHVSRPRKPVVGFVWRRVERQYVRHNCVKPPVSFRLDFAQVRFGIAPFRLCRFILLRMDWLPFCNSSGLDIHLLQHYILKIILSFRFVTPLPIVSG
jgi:hypothetical protein